jgi:16S rRNA (uracil1498-N3)-methyltransferase
VVTGEAEGLRRRPLAFVADLAAPELDEDDHHHLARVLRLRPGTEITLADGTGRWRVGRFDRHPAALGEVHPESPAPDGPTVAFTPVKGERPEWVVQKLTELHVARIVVLEADRSVVRWDGDRAVRNLARWRRVAREASMQSRRLRPPDVRGPVGLPDVLAAGVALAEPGGRPPAAGDVGLAIGPEGGWSPAELAAAPERVALPGGILRAETAAVVAGALLVALRDGLAAPAGPGTHHGR